VAGLRPGARTVMLWFARLMALAIVVQILLAGEGIFGLKNVKKLDDAKTLDAHRALGFIIADPGALLFLIVALLAWHPNTRIRAISIGLPILTFVQGILGGGGRWVGMFHPLVAFILLAGYGWLGGHLYRERAGAVEAQPATTP
jgi:hypothetical protein